MTATKNRKFSSDPLDTGLAFMYAPIAAMERFTDRYVHAINAIDPAAPDARAAALDIHRRAKRWITRNAGIVGWSEVDDLREDLRLATATLLARTVGGFRPWRGF